MRQSLLVLLFFLPVLTTAQKQGNVWYFGVGAGMDFATGSPSAITGGQTGYYKGNQVAQEGSAVISDANGKLLFYTGGLCLWNRNHKIMPHGDTLYSNSSATQSSVIVPKPGSNSLFYVFTADAFQSYGPTKKGKGYRYSLVDICLDGGRGDVVTGQKNVLLADSSSEKLAACKNPSGSDVSYWVLGHGMLTDSFFAWKVTSAGIGSPVISDVGYRIRAITGIVGQMKFNAAGTKVALTHMATNPGIVEVLDFNPTTGVVSNPCLIKIDSGNTFSPNAYGIEFSPDGSRLYVSLAPQAQPRKIYQYNLNAGSGNCDSVKASRYTLFSSVATSSGGLVMGMQAGPDGKIYVVDASTRVGRIINPNLLGSAAVYDSAVLNTGNGIFTLPSFIAGFNYHNGVPPCLQIAGIASIENDVAVIVYPNPAHEFATLAITSLGPHTLNITLTDIQGRVVWASAMRSLPVGKSEVSVPMEGLAAGQYFYRLNDDKGRMLASGAVVRQ